MQPAYCREPLIFCRNVYLCILAAAVPDAYYSAIPNHPWICAANARSQKIFYIQ